MPEYNKHLLQKADRKFGWFFIPQTGKASYDTTKAYRPISSTSFAHKTVERILVDRVKRRTPDEKQKHIRGDRFKTNYMR